MTLKKIAFLTGKRGGMDAMKMTLASLDRAGHEVEVIATDQHLFSEFGYTLQQFQRDINYIIPITWYRGTATARMSAMGDLMTNLPSIFAEFKPDILLLIGDRTESLIAAIIAHNMRICIAHVQGGDVTGGVDDAQRHAITKLANLHFVSTAGEYARVLGLGEGADLITVSGDPHIDRIVAGHLETEARAREQLDLGIDEPFILVLHHSNTLYPDQSRVEMEAIVGAVEEVGIRPIYIYPSSDQGYEHIISLLPPEQSCRNIESNTFLALLKATKAIVGNSSAGIIEAPCFGTPAINVGDRQKGRMMAGSVHNKGIDRDNIAAGLRIILDFGSPHPPCWIYGQGKCHEIITETLTALEINAEIMDKRMTF